MKYAKWVILALAAYMAYRWVKAPPAATSLVQVAQPYTPTGLGQGKVYLSPPLTGGNYAPNTKNTTWLSPIAPKPTRLANNTLSRRVGMFSLAV